MDTLVLITSVINPPDTGFNYCATRSQFTCEERFVQTCQTIKSVRQYIPGCKILLIETSMIPEPYTEYLVDNCDYFLQMCDNVIINSAVCSQSKSFGEGTQTIYAINYILEHKIQFDKLLKISGRYSLTQDFLHTSFQNTGVTVKQMVKDDGCCTVMYCMTRDCIKKFRNWLRSYPTQTKMLNYVGYEVLFSEYITLCDCQVNIVECLGVTGRVSIDDTWYSG